MLRSSKIAKAILLAGLAFAVLPVAGQLAQAQAILPEGLTQFTDANGAPLAAGSVGFYIPSTLTGKTTWSDSALSVQNANPVPLDAAGRAAIWGKGSYRQIVKDVNGNQIWDRVTSATDWGNVTITGGSISGVALAGAGLTANSVANTALAQMPTKTVKSNLLSSTANAADNTVTSVLDVIGSTQGSLMYRGATAWTPLTPGTAGQFLQTAGTAANPSWVTVPNVAAQFSGLVITTVGGGVTATLTANSALLNNGTIWQSVFSPSLTISTATNGANGLDTGAVANSNWYSVWIIYNPTTSTTAGLLSLSATTPTLPSGYTFKVRAGWVRYATGALAQTLQIGQRAQYVVSAGTQTPNTVVLANGPAGSISVPTWIAVSWATCAPTTSSALSLGIAGSGVTSNAILAPNSQYGGAGSTTNSPLLASYGSNYSQGPAIFGDIVPETANVYWAGNSGTVLWCKGWQDNL